MPDAQKQTLSPQVLAILRCPLTRSPLRLEGDFLVAEQPVDAGMRYPIKDGIPVLLMEEAQLPEGIQDLDSFKAMYGGQIPPDTLD